MFQTREEFLKTWKYEAKSTQKVLDQLTDETLNQQITPDNWTLGRLAWHLATAVGGLASVVQLSEGTPAKDYPVPDSAKVIADTYRKDSEALASAINEKWTDAALSEEQDFFGRTMTKASALYFILQHQTHHRGQMTVLMRQAGLRVPGVYGPSKEEWADMGMSAPKN
ncbi:DinB family protein [Peribacillus sp. SCS-37]|uniref:DinB family protein n=1 Tax=Paraperibacillus esterisolvens TaxID=3115296 RepID=UPI0039057EAF